MHHRLLLLGILLLPKGKFVCMSVCVYWNRFLESILNGGISFVSQVIRWSVLSAQQEAQPPASTQQKSAPQWWLIVAHSESSCIQVLNVRTIEHVSLCSVGPARPSQLIQTPSEALIYIYKLNSNIFSHEIEIIYSHNVSLGCTASIMCVLMSCSLWLRAKCLCTFFLIGESVIADINGKSCSFSEQCAQASVNFGKTRTVLTNECCTTDLCNSLPAPGNIFMLLELFCLCKMEHKSDATCCFSEKGNENWVESYPVRAAQYNSLILSSRLQQDQAQR